MVRTGQRFCVGATSWRVVYVTPCRAHCVSEAQHTVTLRDRRTGLARTFAARSSDTMNISPDSQIELLQDVYTRRTS